MVHGALATVGDLLAQEVNLYACCRCCGHRSRVDLGPIAHGLRDRLASTLHSGNQFFREGS
jgi:hypothetical protein